MKKLTQTSVRSALRSVGVTLKRDEDGEEFIVNFSGAGEATAYYTPDLDDALATGFAMAQAGQRETGLANLRDALARYI